MYKRQIHFRCHQIRDYTLSKQRQVDYYPYGGGQGMSMQAQPIYDCCVEAMRQIEDAGFGRPHVVFLTAGGRTLTQERCKQLAHRSKASWRSIRMASLRPRISLLRQAWRCAP